MDAGTQLFEQAADRGSNDRGRSIGGRTYGGMVSDFLAATVAWVQVFT